MRSNSSIFYLLLVFVCKSECGKILRRYTFCTSSQRNVPVCMGAQDHKTGKTNMASLLNGTLAPASRDLNVESNNKTETASMIRPLQPITNTFCTKDVLQRSLPKHAGLSMHCPEKDKAKVSKLQIRTKFASPTDRLLSPCSQKLTKFKSKLLAQKVNPMKLNFVNKKLSKSASSDIDDDIL